jgi:beta-galactosidase
MLVERPTPAGTQQNGDNQTFNWGYYDELRSWSWSVPDGQAVRVRVYTSGDSVTLRLNGSTVAINALTEADKRVTVFTIPYSPGTLTAVASRSGKEISRVTLQTVGAPAKLRCTADLTKLTTDRDQLAHVLIEVLDAAGRVAINAPERASSATRRRRWCRRRR